MSIYPRFYFKKITDINPEFLKENNIKALILDVDNTLLDFDLNYVEGLDEWYKSMIVSNSNKTKKVEMVANFLEIPYIKFATKPLKRGFKKAIKQINLPAESIAAVGDQIFTDVIGSNRMKMVSILVEPLAEKDIWMTKVKRPIENLIIKKYLKKING